MDSIGEFAILEEVLSTTSSDGDLLARGGRDNQGIVDNPQTKKNTIQNKKSR